MKILITGKGGQLAWELEQTVPGNVELVSFNALQLDITNQAQVNEVVLAHVPDIIINAAAYTAVDKAETDQETAFAVNDKGSEYLALVCREINAKLIHVSTDFVFDGTKTTPYQSSDTPNPINVYGDSKLQGDIKVSEILGNQATIIRTAWVYSAHGNNFVKTMLRLMEEKDQLGIVYDQVGTPTWAKGLAQMIWQLVEKQGIRNKAQERCNKHELPLTQELSSELSSNHEPAATLLHWTDAGVASWYDFAVAIQELAIEKGMLEKRIPIRPIPASHYPTPAKRPSFSVIDKTTAEQVSGVETKHWREQLSAMLDELAERER
ncbi:dTDP-4-dehydrorhamnose reductase [Photobacterium aphoticum]|uniref:dTDP-4-dehydrorhamnose reductase n=1 Tax=Photobacterium aphoticum TaxID=754436 RepID=A0A0J1GLG9_9GAMM|nr:dTDP-4-dehydrorhamnose reductase [Photobacterium aphoticum]KLV00284.1 dTDP-4-dehydrorhamnose reductase [Photobacterium aphoticum]PSU59547.1 dTDP-4-dehydrorhamnose reductase [Photobacterium aphoticum]GHA39828.1 NAD(P)-dependent oxidoreductase [Photobacterium aphoticum]